MTAAHCTESLRSRQAIITMGHRSSSLRRAKNERFTQVREVEAIIEHFGKIVLLQMPTRQKSSNISFKMMTKLLNLPIGSYRCFEIK